MGVKVGDHINFLVAEDSYDSNQATKNVWAKIQERLGTSQGICYYRHPIMGEAALGAPDLTLLARDFQPLAVRCFDYTLNDIVKAGDYEWTFSAGDTRDSPIREVEDFVVRLANKFHKERRFRRIYQPIGVAVFSHIARSEFERKFKDLDIGNQVVLVFANLELSHAMKTLPQKLSDFEWRLAQSVFQGANVLNSGLAGERTKADKIGATITILEKEISLLDEEQHKVAVQMAPGPQRIRGLAGTGKTVVLAMKAANIHQRYPNLRLLFTFNTQSLYNQVRRLITKFYRVNSDEDPNWENLHVRHAWGGARRPGVYSDLCRRQMVSPLDLRSARQRNWQEPFRACCEHILGHDIKPYYDFILMDEAQDFPIEFYRILGRLVTEKRRIYWAYDELQNLANVELPSPEEQFGVDGNGFPLISTTGDDYPGGIEKDFVLHRSYRCPTEILILAHAIGLGIHNPRGCIQMLPNRSSWTSIGYVVEEGDFTTGARTKLYRPPEFSPNPIKEIYTGSRQLVRTKSFQNRDEEFKWVVRSIAADLKEGVRAEDIVVISLNRKASKEHLNAIQVILRAHEIASIIPGLTDDSWEFAEEGRITLSTVFRAKGNETPVVYIVGFEYLYRYSEEIEARNYAFTSISRAKGWVTITGVEPVMKEIQTEINRILEDSPRLVFDFPDMRKVKGLDSSETTRRRQEIKAASTQVKGLLGLEQGAFQDLDEEELRELQRKLDARLKEIE